MKHLLDIIKLMGGTESISGSGSTLARTDNIINGLSTIFKKFNVKTVLDIPCGDFHWMQNVDYTGITYIGGDIVGEMIVDNNEKYKSPTISFAQMDITSTTLPVVDVIIVRDCLVHLPTDQAQLAIKNILKSGIKYLLITTFPGRNTNTDIQIIGDWRPINFQIPPFNFPHPL
jgi:2-polyprenyl-3-methyl-5-hydroxy-6-metoxy-1,4-benzoquinol methylase